MAGAVEVTTLELVYSARNELLRQKTQESVGIVADFEKAAEREIIKLEQRMGGLRTDGLSQSLKSVRKEFSDTFTDIQKMAANALQMPANDQGGFNLGAAQARQAAEAARQQASATRIIAEAAQRAAVNENELTHETDRYVRAALTAASAAEKRADDLMREAGALERLEIETLQAAKASGLLVAAQDQAGRATGRAVVSTGQMRAAQQQLTYNLGDAVTMWGMGMRPMQIFVSQASQVTGAIGLMSNSSKGFIGFIGGPWRQVIIAAVAILGVMTAGEKDAASAKKVHKEAADELREAVDRLNNAANAASQATRQGIVDSINAAKAYRERALEARKAAIAELELARAQLQKRSEGTANAAGMAGEDGGLAAGVSGLTEASSRAQIREIEKRIDALNGAVTAGSKAQIAGVEQLLQRAADGRTDPRAAIQQRFQDRDEEIRREARRTGNFSNLDRDLGQNRAQRDASLEALSSGKGAARRAEAERQKGLSDDYSYVSEERQARKRLLDATLRTAESEAERDKLLREDIAAEAATQAEKINIRRSQGKISEAEAKHLLDLNERTRAQKIQNIEIERASEAVQRKATIEDHDLDAKIALLRIQQDLVSTNDERRRIAREVLALEQQQARARLQRTIDDPRSSPEDRDQAKRDIDARAPIENAQREVVNRQNESPLERYRREIQETGANLNDVFENIEVRGLDALNDGLTNAIMNSENLGDVFKNVASSIIADLIRIAIQQTIVNQLMGAIGGIFGGGSFSLPGIITGYGSGTFDTNGKKVPGFSGGGYTGGIGREKVAGVVHGEEFVFDAEATARIGVPTLEAIRKGTFKGPSIGGAVDAANSAAAARSGGLVRIELAEGAMFVPRVQQISGEVSVHVVRTAAPELTNQAVAETTRQLTRSRM